MPPEGPPPQDPARPTTLRPRPSGRGGALLPTLAIVGAIVVVFVVFTGYYTQWLWFQSVGFSSVFTKELTTRLLLFGFFGLFMGVALGFTIWLAYRLRPAFRGMTPEQQNLERYRVSLEPVRRRVVIAVAVLFGLLAGATAAGEWRTYLLFANSQPFGISDPQFGTDVSFYAFRLPFLRFLVGFGFGTAFLCIVAAAVVHYLYGGIKLQSPGERFTPAARGHLSVLIGIFVLLKMASYWLDRFDLVVSDGTRFTGAGYTDVNAILPAKNILMWIALVCALLFFVNVFRRTWQLPLLGLGLLVLSAVVIGGIYPAVVQRFEVRPSEPGKESPYIQRNIDATRQSYGLAGIQEQEYQATSTPTAAALAADRSTVDNVRLLDPAVVSDTYQQVQQIRGFYGFPDPLDVDRYVINGEERDAVVAVREIDYSGLPDGQQNFANRHTTFTHGFGFVAAYGNTAQADGSPSFFSFDVPNQGELKVDQPRIYFGENTTVYSIVGGPAGSAPQELDFPDDSSATGQSNNTYAGAGGVPVGSLFNRLVFAVRFQEGNILLSDLVNSDSKILWDRTPRERVEQVAPWLTVDGDAYPAVVDGRIVWVVDGYTTSNGYPYSQRTTLGEATADALTENTRSVIALQADQVNYIKNSVKAVVDAYDGTVKLYEWDTTDPVLKVWEKAFPGTVESYEQIPESLLPHLRYPEDLFKVQRNLLARYHVTTPLEFYSGQDFWKVPSDPTATGASGVAQPPYYLSVKMPGQPTAAFSLTTTFAPQKRETLAAFMAVNAEPGPDYGTIRLLRLPRNTTIPGPGQVQNNFESDPDVSRDLALFRSQGSDVDLGNLLTLPVGGGLLYVEPLYIKASSGQSYPLLRKVLVSFGNRVGYATTLEGALAEVFGESTGGKPDPDPGTEEPGSGSAAKDLADALSDAQKAIVAADEALKIGDFAAYGVAQSQLEDAIARAVIAQRELDGSPAPDPSASADPGISPSPSAAAATFAP